MYQAASLAKLTRPHTRNAYFREKFFSILDKCRQKPVIWLSAPPGAGKTTLISSYVESRQCQCLWYQADAGDRDPATFFHYMGAAAMKANPKKKKPLPHFTPEYLLGLQAFSREFFSELCGRLERGSLIIFDNYQEVPAESVVHEVIHEGLAGMPKGVNAVIISRTMPPPVLSRMRLSQLMEVISWNELRLTHDEVKGIASKRRMKNLTDEEVRSFLVRTDGWVAGLVCMLDSAKTEDVFSGPVDMRKPDEVFEYFANEFFQKLNDEVRVFLMKTSVLPTMTSGMAEELTGNKRSEDIISELVHKNYFIQTHASDQICYQYHPLFREFLIARLEEANPGDLVDTEKRAALILEVNGHPDEAVRLFHKLGDWNSLASLIGREATVMLGQGRHRTLEDWLGRLPERVMEKDPWLLFWKGSCLFPFDQARSRLFFEKAYKAFYARKDPYGTFLSFSGIIDAIIHEFDDLKLLDRWIEALDGLLKEHPEFPSKEIEARVSFSMFFALSFRAPGHPNIRFWVDKTYAILNEVSDPAVLAQIGLCLADYFIWTGDLEKANVIVERLSKTARRCKNSPMALISIRLSEALNGWFHGNLPACIEAVSEGLDTAEKRGVNVFNYFLYGHGAVSSFTCGDLRKAEDYLKKAALVMNDKKRLCASYYHHLAACFKLLKKDLPGSLEHEKLSLDLAVEAGSPFAEAMSRTGMALLYYEMGERQKAASEIKSALALALKTGSRLVEYVCYLFEAYFALEGGDRNAAAERLKEAFALGARKGFVNFHMWREDIMARLCALGLEEGIEAEYARRIILERDLFPGAPPLEAGNWPWRLKICTLGLFSVVRDGVPLKFTRKVPKKQIEMLKLLIALGGKDVPEDRISDALWKDAEGDAAHVAFTTTLKRLRLLLGVDNAIVLRDGRLAFNERYCWVDAWVFNDLLDRARQCSSGGRAETAAALMERAVELFSEGFNIESGENPWVILFCERIKSSFLRTVVKLGAYWEDRGEFEKAIEAYKKGIEADFLSEELYQRLMLCLQRHGQRAEALALYKRLTKVFADVLGVEPASKTKNIYKAISAR